MPNGLFDDLMPKPVSADGLSGMFSDLPTKVEADQSRFAKMKADNPDAQWSSASDGATKSFNPDGVPYHDGALGSTERWADSVIDANVGQLVQGAGGVVRNIGDLFGSSPVVQQMVSSQPMLNMIPGADRNDLGGQLTQQGIDIAAGGAATQNRGQDTFSVRRPDSILQEPLQAAGYFGNMGANSALPLGVAVALPEIGLPMMGAQSYGQEYDKRRNEGRDIGDSMMSAGIHGAAEILPETKALHVITGALGSTGKKIVGDKIASALEHNIIARVGGATLAESASEGVTQIAQDSNDRFAMGDNITNADMLGNLRDAMGAGAAMGGPAATAEFVATHGSLKGDKPGKPSFMAPTQLRGAEAGVDGAAAPLQAANIGQLFEPAPASLQDTAPSGEPAFEQAPASLADKPAAAMPQQDGAAVPQTQVSMTSDGAEVQPLAGQNLATGMFDDLVPQQQEQATPVDPVEPPTAQTPSPMGGLFGAPTPQEVVQGASRAADDKRNGKTGAVIPGVGGLPLFAGDAPIQGDMGSNAPPAAPITESAPASLTQPSQDAPAPIPTEDHPNAPGNEHLLQLPDGKIGTDEPPTDTKRKWLPTQQKDTRGRTIYTPALDYSRGDSLVHWLAANGGVDFEQMRKQTGVDKAALKDPKVMNPLGKVGISALRRKGGMTIEQAFERMQQDGWFPQHDPNAPAATGAQDAADMIHEALNGQTVYHPYEGAEARIMDEARSRDAEDAADAQKSYDATQDAAAEQTATTTHLRDQHKVEIADADAAEAHAVYQAERAAAEAGVPEDAVTRGDNESRGEYIDRLKNATKENASGADTRANETDQGSSVQGRQGGQEAGGESSASEAVSEDPGKVAQGGTSSHETKQIAKDFREVKASEGSEGVHHLFDGDAASSDEGIDAMAADGASKRSRGRDVGNADSKATKVVDKNGEPLTVYHGTTADVTGFSDDHTGDNTGHMTAPLGIFFDEKQSKAQHYAELASDGVPADESVIGATLTIANPKAMTTSQLADVESRDEARALKKQLQAQGYDGIHITDAGQWVAFTAGQVKVGAAVDSSAVADGGYSLEDYDFGDTDFFGEEDAKDLVDEANEVDALRRIKKKKDNSTPPPRTTTRDKASIAYDLDIYTDNGYSEGEIENMPPSQQVKVASDIVRQTFGFKSVTVGNNLNTLEAANHLRFAYRNLQSMAAVMGWPSATFGKIVPKLELVRNASGALAYFSPSENTIAISRENDAFAHEFGHGIDWWVWKKMGYVDPMTGQPKGRGATGKLKLGASLNSPDVEGAFTNMLETMYATHGDAALKIASLEKNILVIQKQIADMEAKAEKLLDDGRIAAIKDAVEKRKAHIERIVEQIAGITNAPKASYKALTDYYLNSRMLDKKHATEAADGGYWQRPTEMFARAFEAYTAHKIEEAGGGFEFLGRSDAGYLQTSVDFIAKAYPQAMERQSIFEAIDHLMTTLNNELTDGVKGELATVQTPNPIPAAAWRQWVPAQAKAGSIIGHIREIQDQAKAMRLQNEAEDLPLKQAKKALRDARNPEQKAFADIMLRATDIQLNARARWGASITGWLHGMESRYPGSSTFTTLSEMFTTTPGKGKVRSQTYEEYRQAHTKKWGNELGAIIDRHHLHGGKWTLESHRQLRDAMVDYREDGARPNYPAHVLAAAKDLRTFHDEMHQWISDQMEKKGQTLGYAKNGYLRRMMDDNAVAADQQGFLKAAASVYEDVFERDIGTLESHKLDQVVQYAGELANTRNTEETKTLRKLARKLALAEAGDNPVVTAEIQQEIDDLLGSGLFDAIKNGFAEEAANDYMARIMGTVASDDFEVQGAQGTFMKSRKLPASADIKLGDYMINDALALSATYMTTAVNKATFEQYIPGEGAAARRLGEIQAGLARDGVLKDDIEEAMKTVSLLTGMYRPSSSTATRRTIASVSAWFTPVLLGRSMMAQIAEPITAAMRTGNATDGMRLFGSVLEDLGAWMPLANKVITGNSKSHGVWRREMAAFTGAVDSHHFSQIMNSRVGTMWATKKPGQKLAAFFTNAFIHPHAMAMRRGAVEVSFRYFKRIAKKANAGNKLAQRDLADLGIDFARDKALVKYLADTMPVMPMVSDLSASPYAQQLSVAVNRFVDETVVEPKIADKARAASTAESSFMYSVLSFQSGFTNNVLLRATDRVAETFKQDGVTEGAKVATATGIAFGVFLAAQTAQYLLRYAMFGKDDVKDELARWAANPMNAVATIASRSGVTGMLDPLVNAVTGVKYSRSFSDLAVGAYFGYGLQALDKLIGSEFRNSPNTNTAERAQVQAMFDLAIAPTIAHIVLKRAPFLAPALAWTSSSRVREGVADALVGPKGTKTGSKSTKTTDSRHSGGHNARTGGRKSGRDGGREGSRQ